MNDRLGWCMVFVIFILMLGFLAQNWAYSQDVKERNVLLYDCYNKANSEEINKLDFPGITSLPLNASNFTI